MIQSSLDIVFYEISLFSYIARVDLHTLLGFAWFQTLFYVFIFGSDGMSNSVLWLMVKGMVTEKR